MMQESHLLPVSEHTVVADDGAQPLNGSVNLHFPTWKPSQPGKCTYQCSFSSPTFVRGSSENTSMMFDIRPDAFFRTESSRFIVGEPGLVGKSAASCSMSRPAAVDLHPDGLFWHSASIRGRRFKTQMFLVVVDK